MMDLNPLRWLLSTRTAPVSVSPSTLVFNWIVFIANLSVYFSEMEDEKKKGSYQAPGREEIRD